MNFYPLGPTAFMNRLCGPDYKYHMVLAQHLYDSNYDPTDYFMYYRRRCSLAGFHVILDNGVYEGQRVEYSLLLRAVVELMPHVVILPDVPHNMGATLSGGDSFKTLLKKQGNHATKTMTVVHAEPGNLEQFCHSYMEALKQSPWIGISRLTEDFGCDGGRELCRRASFIEELKKRKLLSLNHKHHALGMRDGSLEELESLARSNAFNSCDSSAPIWRGLNGVRLDSDTIKWLDYPFDPNKENFSVHLNNALSDAEYNLKEVLAKCN